MLSSRPLRICLISPPLTDPSIPNLAIELLATLARKRGHRVETLHASLHQPRSFAGDSIHSLPAPMAFTAAYSSRTPEELSEEGARAVLADFGHRDGLTQEWGDAFTDHIVFAMNDAALCLDRISAAVGDGPFDIIGFSVGFDAQKLPAAGIARRLRARGHDGLFVAGGTGCDGSMGQAMLEFCAELDLIIQGEAELSWVELVDRVAAGEPPAPVPGAVSRTADGFRTEPERPFDGEFLELDTPDFTSYFEQRARSRYTDARRYVLFESSRGCWWGERRQCTFCGIRNVSGPYRSRPGHQTVSMIQELQQRYAPECLYATDSISDRAYDDDVWPELARRRAGGSDWSLFYETKSDLTRRRAALMAAAGVKYLQPGIESLSSHVLRLMRKGATGLQQVAALKWAQTYHQTLYYSLITRLPGETLTDVQEIIRRISQIHHLPPPGDVNLLALHRFSPHFDDPSSFGIGHIRPFATQRVMYQVDDDLLRRLCYQLDFDFERADGDEMTAARQAFKAAVADWQNAYDAGCTLTVSTAGPLRLIRRSDGRAVSVDVVCDPVETYLLDGAQEAIRLDRLLAGSPAGTGRTTAALDRLVEAGLILADDHAALAVAIPEGADAYRDSGLGEAADESCTRKVPVPGAASSPQFLGWPDFSYGKGQVRS